MRTDNDELMLDTVLKLFRPMGGLIVANPKEIGPTVRVLRSTNLTLARRDHGSWLIFKCRAVCQRTGGFGPLTGAFIPGGPDLSFGSIAATTENCSVPRAPQQRRQRTRLRVAAFQMIWRHLCGRHFCDVLLQKREEFERTLWRSISATSHPPSWRCERIWFPDASAGCAQPGGRITALKGPKCSRGSANVLSKILGFKDDDRRA
jgi:hypothetical protein